jgi:hypothetical protein
MSTKARYINGIRCLYDSTTQEYVDPAAPIVFYDDFITPSTVIPAAATSETGMHWIKKIVGAGPPTAAGIAGANGLVQCALETTDQKQGAEVYMDDRLLFNIRYGLVFETRVKVSLAPNALGEANWGMFSTWADDPNTILYNVHFSADGGLAITAEKDDNATDESAAAITVLATDFHIYRIDCSNLADIKYYVDGNEVAKTTVFDWAAIEANSLVQPFFGVYKVSGAATLGTIVVDYVRIWQKRA